jgi:hypothetical protein
MPIDHSNDGFQTTSNPKYDKVIITSSAGSALTNQFAVGASLGVSASTDVLPVLVAKAYLKGVLASPQPAFIWESSNPDAVSVDQSGICRRTNKPAGAASDLLTFNANGAAETLGEATYVGGISTVKATVLRADGSVGSPYGEIRIIVQAAGNSAVKIASNLPPISVGRTAQNTQWLTFPLTGENASYNQTTQTP